MRTLDALPALALSTLALFAVHCSSSSDTPSATDDAADAAVVPETTGDTTVPETSPETSTEAAATETAAETTSETATETSVPSGTATTSAACGAIPILGSLGVKGSAACTACVNTHCCAEATACGSDAKCSTYRACVAACADSTCTAACTSAAGDLTKTNAVASCRAQQCDPDCNDVSCLGSVSWPAPASGAKYTVTWTFVDFDSGSPLVGLTVKVCPRTDPTCATPSATTTSDAKGTATLTANATADGWDSYVDISGTDIVPTLAYQWFNAPSVVYGTGKTSAVIFSKATFSGLVGVAGATLDPTRGGIVFQALECNNYGLATLQVTCDLADAKTATSYVVGTGSALPSTTATSTDFHGEAALLNVQPGNAKLTATFGAAKKPYGKYDVPVRAGYVTSLQIVPSP